MEKFDITKAIEEETKDEVVGEEPLIPEQFKRARKVKFLRHSVSTLEKLKAMKKKNNKEDRAA